MLAFIVTPKSFSFTVLLRIVPLIVGDTLLLKPVTQAEIINLVNDKVHASVSRPCV